MNTSVESFNPDTMGSPIQNLCQMYTNLQSTGDHVAKIRVTLADFQPMFLERYSNHI